MPADGSAPSECSRTSIRTARDRPADGPRATWTGVAPSARGSARRNRRDGITRTRAPSKSRSDVKRVLQAERVAQQRPARARCPRRRSPRAAQHRGADVAGHDLVEQALVGDQEAAPGSPGRRRRRACPRRARRSSRVVAAVAHEPDRATLDVGGLLADDVADAPRRAAARARAARPAGRSSRAARPRDGSGCRLWRGAAPPVRPSRRPCPRAGREKHPVSASDAAATAMSGRAWCWRRITPTLTRAGRRAHRGTSAGSSPSALRLTTRDRSGRGSASWPPASSVPGAAERGCVAAIPVAAEIRRPPTRSPLRRGPRPAGLLIGRHRTGSRRRRKRSAFRRRRRLAWLGPELGELGGGAGVVRALAPAFAPLPRGRRCSRSSRGARRAVVDRAVVVAGSRSPTARRLVALVGSVPGRGVLAHLRLATRCWSPPRPISWTTVGAVWKWVALALRAAGGRSRARRLATATPAARRSRGPGARGGGLAGLAEAAYAAARSGTPVRGPRGRRVLAIAYVARAARADAARRSRSAGRVARAPPHPRAVARFAAELGEAPAPGGCRRDSRRRAPRSGRRRASTGCPATGRLVDARGAPAALPAGRTADADHARGPRRSPSSSTTPRCSTARDLEREIGSAARLAVENERAARRPCSPSSTSCAPRARASSRPATAQRRRLERDLHDGAQQRLLARRARAPARARRRRARPDRAPAARREPRTRSQLAFGELRELAHGIFPAVLTEGGLAAALVTLADGRAGRGRARRPPGGAASRSPSRPPPTSTVAEAIRDAPPAARAHVESRRAAHARPPRRRAPRDDGAGARPAPLAHVADRVGALGGSARRSRPRGCEAEIPCG